MLSTRWVPSVFLALTFGQGGCPALIRDAKGALMVPTWNVVAPRLT